MNDREIGKQLKVAENRIKEWILNKNYIMHEITGYWSGFNKKLGIYFFFKTNEDLKLAEKNNFIIEIRNKYEEILITLEIYKLIAKIDYEFDSDENVQKHYDGSYFYRLR